MHRPNEPQIPVAESSPAMSDAPPGLNEVVRARRRRRRRHRHRKHGSPQGPLQASGSGTSPASPPTPREAASIPPTEPVADAAKLPLALPASIPPPPARKLNGNGTETTSPATSPERDSAETASEPRGNGTEAAPPSTSSEPNGNGTAALSLTLQQLRERVGDEVIVFRTRPAGPSRFVLRECFE